MISIIPKDLLTLPKLNELEICVFGPGYGESVVLHIPRVGWGVIDSCVARIEETIAVLPFEYLSELLTPQYPKLAFVILTHPHEDHYKGLEKLLKDYPGGIERVCRYAGDGIRELKTYITRQRKASRDVLPGLSEVFRAMETATESGAQLRRLNEMTIVFEKERVEVEGYGTTDIRMIALSPSAESIQKYVEILLQAVPLIGKPVKPLKDKYHNLISVALHLKIGALQVVIGSDLEKGSDCKTGWDCVVHNRDCPDLWGNLVKISHHGSEDGFNSLAWKAHTSKGKPIAILTPFCRGNVILPKDGNLENFRELCQKVGITGAVKFNENLHKYYPRRVVMSATQKTRSFKVIEPIKKAGFIRTRLSLDGTIIECIAENPAKWV